VSAGRQIDRTALFAQSVDNEPIGDQLHGASGVRGGASGRPGAIGPDFRRGAGSEAVSRAAIERVPASF
jgi:hypothetical protein